MGGIPWEHPEMYEKWSPSKHVHIFPIIFGLVAFTLPLSSLYQVANWKTPTLVIHGGKDFRCPETEGIAVFNVLQRKGIPSKFLYFPGNISILHPAFCAYLPCFLFAAQTKGIGC